MYKVTCNGKILHSTKLQRLQITKGKLTLELGKTGLFEFDIYPSHPNYKHILPLLSIVEVYKDETSIFRGRVLNIKYGFYNEKQVTCEGELAFLLDSIVPPHAISGSFSSYLEYVLGIHNSQVETAKQFKMGRFTVGDFAPYEVVEDFAFANSFDVINKKMVEYSGGFLQVRHENGEMYLDLLSADVDASNVSGQKIRLGKNLIDIKREVEGGEVFSGIVPLGAKIGNTENRVDITSVNGGSYSILNETAAAAYGKIFKTVIFENITNAAALLTEGRLYLEENFAAINSIEITAVDLSDLNFDLDSFKVGQWVIVESDPHLNQAQTFLIRKMSINILNPADTKIEVGRTRQGLTDSLGNVTYNINNILSSIGNVAENISNATAKAEAATTTANSAATSATKATTTANNAAATANSVATRVTALESTKPYVTETGTSGIWKWCKYSDNTCEFYGQIPVANYNIGTALGNWFRGEYLYGNYDYLYPIALKEPPAIVATFHSHNGTGALAWVVSANDTTISTYLPLCYLIRPVTGTALKGNLNIIVRGKY